VLDTCFSGQTVGGPLLPGVQLLVPTYATTSGDVTILAAGGATELAGPLPGGGRPAFSYLALGGLLGWADTDADGQISASEIASYAREALRATVRGRTQTPEHSGPDRVLGRTAGQRGPNLVGIVVARPSPPRRIAAVADDDPLLGQLEALHRAQQARIAAERAEADARALLDAQIQGRLADQERAVIQRAARAWAALEPLLAAGGPEALAGARAFVDAYRDASASIGDVRRAVRIPEVDRAVAFLESGDPLARVAKVTPPQPPPMGTVPWGLFATDAVEFGEGFRKDPARAWDLYLAAFHLPAQIAHVCGVGCGEQQLAADALLADIATYTAARLDPRFERISVRELSHLFGGLREEARDIWYAAAGADRPLLLTADFDGFSATAPAAGRAFEARAALIELSVWSDRRGVQGKCVDKIDSARRDLVARYDEIAARLDGNDSAATAELRAILKSGHALAGRALRCR
jgi:hypothetical protein